MQNSEISKDVLRSCVVVAASVEVWIYVGGVWSAPVDDWTVDYSAREGAAGPGAEEVVVVARYSCVDNWLGALVWSVDY